MLVCLVVMRVGKVGNRKDPYLSFSLAMASFRVLQI